MPDDSNGVYSLPAGTIVSTGDTILPSQHNPWANDNATAMSNRFSKDGRAPATGNWNLNNFRITGLGTPVATNDATSKSYVDAAVGSPVQYVLQTLTAPQQAIARSNIGAALKGQLFGLTLSNNVTDSVNDIDISAGEAASTETNPALMVLASSLTKRLDGAWAVGTNSGGLDTGSIANGTYHVWLIRRSDTGVVDALFSASATSPTMPASYDQKRRIGSILRESGAIVGFQQFGDIFQRNSVVSLSSTGGFAAQLISLQVPTGFPVQPILHSLAAANVSTSIAFNIGDAWRGPSGVVALHQFSTGASNADIDAKPVTGGFFTNDLGQIYMSRVVSTGSLSVHTVSTRGWIDTRGRS